jgi:hypothetical protein
MANYHFKQPPLVDNQEVDNMHCSQLQPNTPIAEGVTGLVFTNCNLKNCLLPPDAIVGVGCNTSQTDYCAHNHPEFNLPSEGAENETCRHAVEEIKIDGVVVGYIREDIQIG